MWTMILELYNYSNFNVEYVDHLDTHYFVDDITRGTTFVISTDPNIQTVMPENTFYRLGEGIANDVLYKVVPNINYSADLSWYTKEDDKSFSVGKLSINDSSGLVFNRGVLNSPIEQIMKMSVIVNNTMHIQNTNDPIQLPWADIQNIDKIYVRFENRS